MTAAVLVVMGVTAQLAEEDDVPGTPGTSEVAAETAADTDKVTMPDVAGLPLDEAEPLFAGLGLEWESLEEDGDAASVVAGGNWEVVGQDPEPGTALAAGYEATLTVVNRKEEDPREGEREHQEREAEQAPVAADPGPSGFDEIGQRDFALLVKNPDDYVGGQYVLYGEVAQFDSNTGSNTFWVRAASRIVETSWLREGEGVFVKGDPDELHDVLEDDVLKLYVRGDGSLSYKNTFGGSGSAPLFELVAFEVID